MLSLVFMVLVQTGAGEESTCCWNKTVGAYSYTLIHNHTAPIPSTCKNNCIYERNDQDGSRYCFAVGENQVQCQPHSVEYYPDTFLKNSYFHEVKGQIDYLGCSDDSYDLHPGKSGQFFRGVCLITRIFGTDVTTGDMCTPYTSSGTSYSQFEIIANPHGPGCYITRVTSLDVDLEFITFPDVNLNNTYKSTVTGQITFVEPCVYNGQSYSVDSTGSTTIVRGDCLITGIYGQDATGNTCVPFESTGTSASKFQITKSGDSCAIIQA